MKYLIPYKIFEGKLEDDFTWWFGENHNDDSPLIHGIKVKIEKNYPNALPEFYYRLSEKGREESDIFIISDIFNKYNMVDTDALSYLGELKRRDKMKNAISRINGKSI